MPLYIQPHCNPSSFSPRKIKRERTVQKLLNSYFKPIEYKLFLLLICISCHVQAESQPTVKTKEIL